MYFYFLFYAIVNYFIYKIIETKTSNKVYNKRQSKALIIITLYLNKVKGVVCRFCPAGDLVIRSSYNARRDLRLLHSTRRSTKILCFWETQPWVFLILSRNTSQKLNRNSASTCLTDMIHIFIECNKLLLYKEIIQIKNSFISLCNP